MAEESSNEQHEASSGGPTPRDVIKQNPKPTTKALDSNDTVGTISTATKMTTDKKENDAQSRLQSNKNVESDERRDERGQKATPGSSGAKTQPRAPPSPHKTTETKGNHSPINRLQIFDWPGEEKDQAVESPNTKMPQGLSRNQGELERPYRTDQVGPLLIHYLLRLHVSFVSCDSPFCLFLVHFRELVTVTALPGLRNLTLFSFHIPLIR